MDFSTNVEPTQPSAAEETLLTESAETARQARTIAARQQEIAEEERLIEQEQTNLQRLLLPELLGEAGFDTTLDAEGNIISLSARDEELDPNEVLREEVETASLERALAGLEGRLPIDPATEEQFGRQAETLGTALRRQLGPGFATSTPGIQALSEQEFQQNLLRTAVREGQISSSFAGAASLQGARQLGLGAQGQRFGQLFGAPNVLTPGQGGFARAGAGFLGAGQGFLGAAAPFQADRFANLEVESRAAQSQAQLLGSIFSAIGGAAGTLGAAKILSG